MVFFLVIFVLSNVYFFIFFTRLLSENIDIVDFFILFIYLFIYFIYLIPPHFKSNFCFNINSILLQLILRIGFGVRLHCLEVFF